MKKAILFYLFCLSIGTMQSQTVAPLLNKEAYNFSVGDTLEYLYYRGTKASTADIDQYFYQWVVKGVSYSSNLDTLKVSVLEKHDPSDDTDLKKYTKNKLAIFQPNETVFKNLPDTIFEKSEKSVLKDTTYLIKKYPTEKKMSKREIKVNSLFPYLYIQFVEDLGMVDYNFNTGGFADGPNNFPDLHHEQLRFYHKGNEKWGSKHQFPVGTKEIEQEMIITLMPNPVQHTLLLDSTAPFEQYQIIDMNGAYLKNDNIPANQQINIEDLPNGVYILQLKHGNQYRSSRFVKQ